MSGTLVTPVAPGATGARVPVEPDALFCGEETIAGTVTASSTGHGAEWADAVVASCARGERILAALPFAPGAPAIAHRVRLDAVAVVQPTAEVVDVQVRSHSVTEHPAPEVYAARVGAALGEIEAGRIEKVVLGRELHVTSQPPLDAHDIIERLRANRPGRYVFGVPLAPRGSAPAPVLLGASPELLVRRRGSAVSSFPLAGSIPRVADPVEDQRRADALLTSVKDLHEHAFVVDAIVAALEPLCATISADERPRLVSTDKLHHLGTRIDAILRPDAAGASALHLAQLLHPTPAVGGTPRSAALELIERLEDDRGQLTGTTGWVDHRGDGEFAVTIRAGVLDGEQLRLYAGAGIVAGSDPQAEVRETGAKLATMRAAVGL